MARVWHASAGQHTGTSSLARRSTGSARRCCHHAGYCVQDPKHYDLADLLHASHLRNLHRRLHRRSFLLVVATKGTNHDVAAKHGKEQQRGTQQRRAQPADHMIILWARYPSLRATGNEVDGGRSRRSSHSRGRLHCRAFWMQTTGTSLFAAIRNRSGRMRVHVQVGRQAHVLLYSAAVRHDSCQQEHRQGAVDIDPKHFGHCPVVGYCCSPQARCRVVSLGGSAHHRTVVSLSVFPAWVMNGCSALHKLLLSDPLSLALKSISRPPLPILFLAQEFISSVSSRRALVIPPAASATSFGPSRYTTISAELNT
jgi:hypothetical protein